MTSDVAAREALPTPVVPHETEGRGGASQASKGAFASSWKSTWTPGAEVAQTAVHSLPPRDCCGVAEQDTLRVMKFLASTDWNNEAALKCQLAAMILALCGRNVERAFWTQGPGGVGQSLNTDLIANTFGSNHSFVNMNIYFTPDEFRKHAEGLIGECVVTGQPQQKDP